ncbi:MAG: hypothetical protein KAS32_30365 [Candidatus Peribacteraceae bacterium]|nr:hypothetical protein [Candidatus Peribacteraceae bacterium]
MSICVSAVRYLSGDKIGIKCNFLNTALGITGGVRITTESVCKCCDNYNPDYIKRDLYEELGIDPPEEQLESDGGEEDTTETETEPIEPGDGDGK